MNLIVSSVGAGAAIRFHHIFGGAIAIGSPIRWGQEGQAAITVFPGGIEAGEAAAGHHAPSCRCARAGDADVIGLERGLAAHVVLDADAAQALQGGAVPIELDHADGVVFLEGDVGLFAIATDSHIFGFQVLGDRVAAFARQADAEGCQFSVAAVEAAE